MRIALDARQIYRSDRRATGKTLIDLYRQVAKLRPDWQIVAYHRGEHQEPSGLKGAGFQPRVIEMIGDRFDAWERWRLPMAAWQDGVDLLHCPANTCPTWMPIPTVVTVHDLIPLDMPQAQSPYLTSRFEQSVRIACQLAWVICPSHYTADRLVAQFGADPGRITVIPWAPDTSIEAVPEPEWQPVLNQYHIAEPFVLHFGSGEVRKNTRRLIEAWSMLDDDVRDQWQLVIVGLAGAGKARAAQWVARYEQQSSVRLFNFAEERDLPTLLSAAGILAYPSLSEGFGLPILEGWAAGTPVLCGDATSLPEVAGDAAIQIDPTRPSAIADGLAQMLRNKRLRHELAVLGRERLAYFSWQSTAERFIETIQRAAGTEVRYRAAA